MWVCWDCCIEVSTLLTTPCHNNLVENCTINKYFGVYQFEKNKQRNKAINKALSLAPTRRFFPASGLCLSLPNISCVGLRQVKQRNELSHLAFLMRSIASLLLKHKHVIVSGLCVCLSVYTITKKIMVQTT